MTTFQHKPQRMDMVEVEWNDELQRAYDSILFNHNPIEVDKQFAQMLEAVFTTIIESQQKDRHSLHIRLVAAVTGKKTREMQPGENRAKYLAFQRGEEHMKGKVLIIINSIFKE